MQLLLDIDLDFFLSDILYTQDEPKGRPSSARFKVDEIAEVLDFLHNRCKLPINTPKPGAICIHHKEVFFHWQKLIKKKILIPPFEVIHIDAHADMGFGNASCLYIAEEYLADPVARRTVPLQGGPWAVNNCNFLAYALASRWIGNLTYVTHPKYEDDVQWVHMKDFSTQSGAVQMKRFKRGSLQRLKNPQDVKKLPFQAEPEIPMTVVARSDFTASTEPDFIFLSHSPNYCPKSADALFERLQSLILPIPAPTSI